MLGGTRQNLSIDALEVRHRFVLFCFVCLFVCLVFFYCCNVGFFCFYCHNVVSVFFLSAQQVRKCSKDNHSLKELQILIWSNSYIFLYISFKCNCLQNIVDELIKMLCFFAAHTIGLFFFNERKFLMLISSNGFVARRTRWARETPASWKKY